MPVIEFRSPDAPAGFGYNTVLVNSTFAMTTFNSAPTLYGFKNAPTTASTIHMYYTIVRCVCAPCGVTMNSAPAVVSNTLVVQNIGLFGPVSCCNACFADYNYIFSENPVFCGGVVKVVMTVFPRPLSAVTMTGLKSAGVVKPPIVGSQMTFSAGQTNATMFW